MVSCHTIQRVNRSLREILLWPISGHNSSFISSSARMSESVRHVRTVPSDQQVQDSFLASGGLGDTLITSVQPYLLPCVVEFSILGAAFMCKIFLSVGRHIDDDWEKHSTKRRGIIYSQGCHNSHSGMFLGICLLVATLICTVLIIFKGLHVFTKPICTSNNKIIRSRRNQHKNTGGCIYQYS